MGGTLIPSSADLKGRARKQLNVRTRSRDRKDPCRRKEGAHHQPLGVIRKTGPPVGGARHLNRGGGRLCHLVHAPPVQCGWQPWASRVGSEQGNGSAESQDTRARAEGKETAVATQTETHSPSLLRPCWELGPSEKAAKQNLGPMPTAQPRPDSGLCDPTMKVRTACSQSPGSLHSPLPAPKVGAREQSARGSTGNDGLPKVGVAAI